jgi:dextranase
VPFTDLRTSYLLGQQIAVADLPPGTRSVIMRSASGQAWSARVERGAATLAQVAAGTHAVEAWSDDGDLLAEELTSVRENVADNPVVGFATSFGTDAAADVLSWLTALRCTVVQVYDWMGRYSLSVGSAEHWTDPLGRPVSRRGLTQLIGGVRDIGAVAQAYAPVCAIDPVFAERHREWLLYRGDGQPQSLADLLMIADPGCPAWQRHWLENYGADADSLGFNGFHLDTYGYPRLALDAAGRQVPMAAGYESFIRAVRSARPGDVLSLNQVNGVPQGLTAPGPPGFRYAEVWPPNSGWRHLEGLLQRSAGSAARQGDTLAIYPPVWDAERADALRTVVLTQAIATALGVGTLTYGDAGGVLRGPYYPDHERLRPAEQRKVLAWNRLALRCRDLFTAGTDTSWCDVGDENSALSVSWGGPVSPEPVGGGLFARVARVDGRVAVSLIDLTGSTGSWAAGTGPGACQEAEVTALVDDPAAWHADAAVLGVADGRFRPVRLEQKKHREGIAVAATVPLASGWTVLRLLRQARHQRDFAPPAGLEPGSAV